MNEKRRRFSLGDVIRKLSETGGAQRSFQAAEHHAAPENPPSQQTVRSRDDISPPPGREFHQSAQPTLPDRHHSAPHTIDDEDEPFDIHKYLGVLIRRRAAIIICAVIALGYATFTYVTAPRYFVARARILFSPGSQDIITDYPGAWQTFVNRERLLRTHLELLTSRAVIARLSENLSNTIAPGAINAGLSIARGQTAGEPNDIIEVSFQHPDAQMAREVANEFCRTYIEYHRDVNAQEQTRMILKLEGQIDRQQRDLTAKEDALRGFKESNRMVQLSDETSATVEQVATMEANLQQTQLSLAEASQRLESIRANVSRQEINVVQSMTYDNAYQSRLADLELQLSTISSEYSPEHFRVRILRQQIDTLKKAIANDVQSQVARQTTLVTNPVRQSLLEDIVRLTIEKSALETRLSAQEKLISSLSEKLSRLPSVEQRYVTLEREATLLEETLKMLKREYEQMKIARDSKESDLRIFELASAPANRVSKQKRSGILIGLAIGLLLGIGLAFGLEYIDQTIKDPLEAEKIAGTPILGLVPFIAVNEFLPSDAGELAKTIIEPFRTVRANLRHLLTQRGARTVVVCSAVKGEGKTTLTANLAISFALDGRRVLVIDSDFRRAGMHKLFGLQLDQGLSDYLLRQLPVDQLQKKTPFENISVITAGACPHNPTELIGSKRFSELLNSLKPTADIILIDSPAMLAVSDVITIAPLVDASIVVLRLLWTPSRAARQAVAQLRRLGVPLLGAVVNGIQRSHGLYSSYYGYYSKRYGYGDDTDQSLPHSVKSLLRRGNEMLRDSRYAIPRVIPAVSSFLRSLSRHGLVWVLAILFAGLAVTRRALVPQKLPGDYLDGIQYVEALPYHDSKPTARDSFTDPTPSDSLAVSDALFSWRGVVQAADTAGVLAHYSRDGASWEEGSGIKTGREAVQSILSLSSAKGIMITEPGMRFSTVEPAPTCTTEFRIHWRENKKATALTTVWRNEDGRWVIISHRHDTEETP